MGARARYDSRAVGGVGFVSAGIGGERDVPFGQLKPRRICTSP
jgi:hypothetical protein